MKKNILSALALCTVLFGCQKNEVFQTDSSGDDLHATLYDISTRTIMDGNTVRWSEGDQIVAFMKSTYGHKYQVKSSFVGKTYADFSRISSASGDDLSVGMEWDHNVAYYPYADGIECMKSDNAYTLEVVLPENQTYVAKTFSDGLWPMAAVSEDNNITFRNVCGGIKIQLKGTQNVESVTLQGNNSEILAGNATVMVYTDGAAPSVEMASDASKVVTLDCDTGVQLSKDVATEFIIVIPPTEFSDGFTVTFNDYAGKKYPIVADNRNEVIRSSLLVMPEVSIASSGDEIVFPELTRYDYIDEYGINRGKGKQIGNTVWAPVNCGYHDTDFEYGKLYQWGRKYGHGYYGSLYDGNGLPYYWRYEDSIRPEYVHGPVSLSEGQSPSNSNRHFMSSDWLSVRDDLLWNAGDEENPVRTDNDPCPEGWRVPTYTELSELGQNHSIWNSFETVGHGFYFTGVVSFDFGIPMIPIPACGYHDCYDDLGKDRNLVGYFWSSLPYEDAAFYLRFDCNGTSMVTNQRGNGYSIRCVQE